VSPFKSVGDRGLCAFISLDLLTAAITSYGQTKAPGIDGATSSRSKH
jgi:hypothetical protein